MSGSRVSGRRRGRETMTRRIFLARGLGATGGFVGASLVGCSGDVLAPLLELSDPGASRLSALPGVASLPSGFTYDPAGGVPEDQGFSVEGGGRHFVVNRSGGLQLEVDGTARPRYFAKPDPTIPSKEIHCEAGLNAQWLNSDEGDSGVGFEIDEGWGGRRIWVSCVQAFGEPRVRLDGSDGPALPVNWTGATAVIAFGRTAEGDAYLESPGVGRVEARRRNLPEGMAQEPRYTFGCFFEQPSVTGWFGRIGAPVEDAPPAELAVTNIELQPNAAERVKIEGTLATELDPSTVDIEKVGVRCELAGTRFYPTTGEDLMPVAVRRDGDKWVITREERGRTHIQSLELWHEGDGFFRLHLNDASSGLDAQDYSEVTVQLALHLSDASVLEANRTVLLVQSGRTFRGPA